MEYPKINSLWKRDETHNLIEGDYSRPEFGVFKKWRVEEKIDGTNIRVYVQNGVVEIKGRTSKVLVPESVKAFLMRPEFTEKLSIMDYGVRVKRLLNVRKSLESIVRLILA